MADRYWVGGTAAWNGTAGTKWATTSGGAGGASVPTSADDVFFDVASGAVICTVSTGNTGAKSINCTGFTGTLAGSASITVSGSVTLVAGMTYSYTGTMTLNGTGSITSAGKVFDGITVNGAGITVTLADALTLGDTKTFTLTQGTLDLAGFTLSAGLFSSSNTNTRAISFGASNIVLAGTTGVILNMSVATGFTWTGGGAFFRNTTVGASVTLQFGTSGGTVSNAPNLRLNVANNTTTITSGSWFKNLDFTGTTAATITSNSSAVNVAGNLILSSGGIYTTFWPTFRASGTITSAGRTLGATTIDGAGITVTLADAFVSNGQLDLAQGTFANPSNFNVTVSNFRSNSGATCSLSLGSSTWTITGGGAVASWFANNSGLTFNAGTSTINLTYAGVKEFTARNNSTYYNINVGGAGSFGLYVGSALTINSLTNSVQPATVIFSIGSTYTLSNFGLSGTAGNLITIRSDVPGTRFTLSKASGTVNTQYLSIQDSNAIGGATWDALISNGNVDAGNNTGWNFVPRSNMFLMFI